MGQKRSRIRSGRSRRFALPLTAIAAMMAAIAALAWWSLPSHRCIAVNGDSAALLLNVDGIARGTAQKYCWRTPDSARTVRFIVARRSDDVITVVLDACRVCYLNALGYRFSRGGLICRFCGNRYSIDSLSIGRASCLPFKLPYRIDRGLLRISTSDLKASAGFFPRQSVADTMLDTAFGWLASVGTTNGAEAHDNPPSASTLSRVAALHKPGP